MTVRPPFDPDDPSSLPSTPGDFERWVREVEAYLAANPTPRDPAHAAELERWRTSLAEVRAFFNGASAHGGIREDPAFRGTSVDGKGTIRAWHLKYADEPAAPANEVDDDGPADGDPDRTA